MENCEREEDRFLFLVCVEQQSTEKSNGVGSVVVPNICFFGKFIDYKAISFKRMMQQIRKAAGLIGISAFGTAPAAFVGQQQKRRKNRIQPPMKVVYRFLEIAQRFSHTFKVKGTFQFVFFREQQHRVILRDAITAFFQRTHRRRTSPRGSVITAGIAFTDFADFCIVFQMRSRDISAFCKTAFCGNFFNRNEQAHPHLAYLNKFSASLSSHGRRINLFVSSIMAYLSYQRHLCMQNSSNDWKFLLTVSMYYRVRIAGISYPSS